MFYLGHELQAQVIDPAYKKMIEGYYEDFPLIQPELLQSRLLNESEVVILDTREREEFEVSHIPGARYFGYDNKNWKSLAGIPKDTEIIVYCSIGARSQNIGMELQKKGYTNVKNLYGGVFLWANQRRALENSKGTATNKVHGYSADWGKWIKNAEAVYE
jgi:rhodanese-related sulfurtransferase